MNENDTLFTDDMTEAPVTEPAADPKPAPVSTPEPAPAPKPAPAPAKPAAKAAPKSGSAQRNSPKKPQKGGKKTKKQGGLLSDIFSLLLRILWIGFIAALLLFVICGVTINSGNRMYPAFHDRDIVFYYRLAKDIKAGETVVFEAENGRLLVGRVVAKEGDTVDIDERGLKINDYYQVENYSHGDTVLFEGGISFPVKLKAGQYFVLCDDRSQSTDSRTLGPINSDRIRGRIMLSLRQRDF